MPNQEDDMNKVRLALAIPTFRRSAALAENLSKMMDETVGLGITVYISDDSPDHETERVIEEFATRYDNINYRRNAPPLRHDSNLFETLLWPEEDYVWLLGDSLRPKPGQLKRILDFLADQDLVFVNSHSGDTRNVPFASDTAALDLLRDALWHQTLTGATIYHRRVRFWAQSSRVDLRRNFPQLSVILGYASAMPLSIAWFGEKSLDSAKKQSYWREAALDVFVDDWVSLVSAYPKIVAPDQRRAVLKSHSAMNSLFNLDFLLELKKNGHFGWASTKRPHFWDVMHLGRLTILSILLVPTSVLELAQRLRRSIRSVKRN
jgi:glycosyltransferase involved in cell wall biosynthesis